VRDSFAAASERHQTTSPRGWPDWIGMGGRLPSERVAAWHRNQWPDWIGLRTTLAWSSGTVLWHAVMGIVTGDQHQGRHLEGYHCYQLCSEALEQGLSRLEVG
jgi:hypothetical protein